MRFPRPKCSYAVKLSICLFLIVLILTLFKQWHSSKRSARALCSEVIQDDYEKQILEDEVKIIPELGDGGIPVNLVDGTKEKSENEFSLNIYLSDRIAYNRTVKDARNPACARVIYDAELPSVSVIIVFNKELYSVLIRTIWSLLNSARRDQPWYKRANFIVEETGRTMNLGYPGQNISSPYVYLKEIILVDDNSTVPELKGKLKHYIQTRLPPDLVKIIRLPDQVGLIKARLAGCRVATADILLFLDAHCEVTEDWLRPLLQRIKDSNTAVVTPVIDSIDNDTFEYKPFIRESQVCGFTFWGGFNMIDVAEWKRKGSGLKTSPIRSPAMLGGIFAMNRTYFWELGAYDELMTGWGSENLEISFRIWQCGGTIENIPCSHVGHVLGNSHDNRELGTADINMARVAEVWMDDYAELFYMHHPKLRNNSLIGDVTNRTMLRQKLQCKDFQWYLDNVYKDKFIPIRDVYGYGRFMNPVSGLCLDTLQRVDDKTMPLGVFPCHDSLKSTQYFSLSLDGQLRDEEICAEILYMRRFPQREVSLESRKVFMTDCRERYRPQVWRYLNTTQLQHMESGLCLEAVPEEAADAIATKCSNVPAQHWTIDYTEKNGFRRLSDDVELSEQELKLERLRWPWLKSRPQFSYKPKVEVKEAAKTSLGHRT